jgi:Protein of unknown function DUF262
VGIAPTEERRLSRRTGTLTFGIRRVDKPSRTEHASAQFLDWAENKMLVITPKFQRRSVWSLPQRSYFIDTMLREMPAPPIYLRNIYDAAAKKVVHEVIDGQQRIRSILDFIEGKYALYAKLDSPSSGKKFSELAENEQVRIMKYSLNCVEFHAISDQEVFDIFRRMNTYSTPLSKQELRHGRFFGLFSQSCHMLAEKYLEFWRRYKVLNEEKIARMLEVQLTSSMLIAQFAGMQDKNDSIDSFYSDFDANFPKKSSHESNFCKTMDQIIEAFGESLADLQFRKPPFLYTTFCTIYHRMYGLPKENLKSPKLKRLTPADRDRLKLAAERLSEIITAARKQQQLNRATQITEGIDSPLPYPSKYHEFVLACLSQTDNVNPRRKRFVTLYTEAFL